MPNFIRPQCQVQSKELFQFSYASQAFYLSYDVFIFKFYFLCYVYRCLPVCVSIYHLQSGYPQRPEECVKYPETTFPGVFSYHMADGNQI